MDRFRKPPIITSPITWGPTSPITWPITGSPRGGGAWTPAQLSNLIGWFDASDESTITESVGQVSAWANKGTGADLLQGTGGEQPTTGARTINGLNVLDFDGTENMVDRSFSPNASISFVWFGDVDAVSSGFQSAWATDGTDSTNAEAQSNTEFLFRLRETLGMAFPAHGSNVIGAPVILALILDATAGTGRLFVDSGTASITDSGYDGVFTCDEFFVMTNRAENQNLDGALGEMLVINEAIEIATLNLIGNYIKDKWAATWTDG